jgi:hypothetical protein
MNEIREAPAGLGYTGLHIGTLERASDYVHIYDEAKKLKASAPIFGSAVDGSHLDKLEGESKFRIGAIQFDEIVVMTMRLQKGRGQFIWLADATDPQFWAMVDDFRKTGQAGLGFRSSPSDIWFMPYRTTGAGRSAFDMHRKKNGGKDKGFIELVSVLVSREVISSAAASMIPGLDVEYKMVNVLGTRRAKSAIRAMEVSGS